MEQSKGITEKEEILFDHLNTELSNLKTQLKLLENVIYNGTCRDEEIPAALSTLRDIKKDIDKLEKIERKEDNSTDLAKPLDGGARPGAVSIRPPKSFFTPPKN